MKIEFHPKAAEELSASIAWYEDRRNGLGLEMLSEVDHALAAIAEHPSLWPAWPGSDDDLSIRRFLLPRFPFALAYVAREEKVVILAVAHLRRRPFYWHDRAGK